MLFLGLCLLIGGTNSQLIGHRGVITLREGQVYRDTETVEASEIAAGLALRSYQEDRFLSNQRKVESRRVYSQPPLYQSLAPEIIGRPLQQNEIFDVVDSKFVDVFPEQAFNQPLEEVEVERATSPTRSYPGEGLPQGIHPGPTRAPNRLVDLSRPIEPSIRTQNSFIGTVFDGSSSGYIPPSSISRPPLTSNGGQGLTPFTAFGPEISQGLGAPLNGGPGGLRDGLNQLRSTHGLSSALGNGLDFHQQPPPPFVHHLQPQSLSPLNGSPISGGLSLQQPPIGGPSSAPGAFVHLGEAPLSAGTPGAGGLAPGGQLGSVGFPGSVQLGSAGVGLQTSLSSTQPLRNAPQPFVNF